ncbi:hypothetical protein BV25DRAFT_183148 [Artomyces pyxidatus]|uniref:Uncharacterized protein n=1 Tax=Artomyces pyxidatus TaxID=48021 RepID=A0ACB8T8F5_9AGAM|nr:hypothetical protein BV25DRAFT_183148 [Artomyces pyxidatus]
MRCTPITALAALAVISLADPAVARIRWMERDARPVFLNPRRFGQENPPVLAKLSTACPSDVCQSLAGQAITPLLSDQDECSQQDFADTIIDVSLQFDESTQDIMINIAVEFIQVEKNTPPYYSTNSTIFRNSVYCQRAPRHSQLNGLYQAQDPANDVNVFYDPATKQSVMRGSQPNTFPFIFEEEIDITISERDTVFDESEELEDIEIEESEEFSSFDDVAVIDIARREVPTVTVVARVTPLAGGTVTSSAPAVTVTVGSDSDDIGDFGSCSIPQIEFGVGFDNRRETSFQPTDQISYDHSSADNIDIITKFICDTLTNTCGADDTAKATCATAQQAADAEPTKTGAQADAFNAIFGVTTNFAYVTEIDDQGNVVGSTSATSTSAIVTSSSVTSTSSAALSSAVATATASASVAVSTSTAAAPSAAASSSIGNFGSCSVPQIQFAVGFDGRTETSFEPVDKTSFAHDSADNIDIITKFICDTLTNTCGADATAKATCAKASAAADAQTPKTGAQADAFNAVFEITTNFASVTEIDDQGNVVSGASAAATTAAAVAPATSSAEAAPATQAAPVTQAAPTSQASAPAKVAASSPEPSAAATPAATRNIGNIGSCSVPQIQFGVGFDGRRETSFEPVDQKSFSHGSADNISVITQFICSQLSSKCGADATAKATCASAESAANSAAAQTGAQADAFNAVFGTKTNFAAVAEVNNKGQVVA